MAYLAGKDLDVSAFAAVAEYLAAFIHQASHGPCASPPSPAENQQLQELRRMATDFTTREDLDKFVSQAADLGLDPF